jgi:hypothetical protein
VQEHGYPQFTVDVDIIVPDVEFAIEKLSLNGFKVNPGSRKVSTYLGCGTDRNQDYAEVVKPGSPW